MDSIPSRVRDNSQLPRSRKPGTGSIALNYEPRPQAAQTAQEAAQKQRARTATRRAQTAQARPAPPNSSANRSYARGETAGRTAGRTARTADLLGQPTIGSPRGGTAGKTTARTTDLLGHPTLSSREELREDSWGDSSHHRSPEPTDHKLAARGDSWEDNWGDSRSRHRSPRPADHRLARKIENPPTLARCWGKVWQLRVVP